MKTFPRILPLTALLTVLLCSCGKPPAGQQGPPPGDWPANAVVAKAKAQDVDQQINLLASLAAKEMVSLVSELDAKVTEINFAEGQRITKGDLLFQLDQVVTSARLKEAEVAYEMTQKTFTRSKQLIANQTISQQEFDEAESKLHANEASLVLAKDDMEKTRILAPFNGVIGEKQVSPGQFVSRGQALADLIQDNPLQVVFDVPERHIGSLKPNLKINFQPEAFSDETFTGTLSYTAPLVDNESRTLRVKAEIPNTDGRLKPGMFGELSLILSTRKDAVVIPEAAVQLIGGGPMLVTVDENGISGFRPVKTGQRSKGQVEIIEGLAANEMVVVEGYQKMGPGMKVIATPESEAHGVTPGPLFKEEAPPPAAPALEEEKQSAEKATSE